MTLHTQENVVHPASEMVFEHVKKRANMYIVLHVGLNTLIKCLNI